MSTRGETNYIDAKNRCLLTYSCVQLLTVLPLWESNLRPTCDVPEALAEQNPNICLHILDIL
jgi:hypothetical protein